MLILSTNHEAHYSRSNYPLCAFGEKYIQWSWYQFCCKGLRHQMMFQFVPKALSGPLFFCTLTLSLAPSKCKGFFVTYTFTLKRSCRKIDRVNLNFHYAGMFDTIVLVFVLWSLIRKQRDRSLELALSVSVRLSMSCIPRDTTYGLFAIKCMGPFWVLVRFWWPVALWKALDETILTGTDGEVSYLVGLCRNTVEVYVSSTEASKIQDVPNIR